MLLAWIMTQTVLDRLDAGLDADGLVITFSLSCCSLSNLRCNSPSGTFGGARAPAGSPAVSRTFTGTVERSSRIIRLCLLRAATGHPPPPPRRPHLIIGPIRYKIYKLIVLNWNDETSCFLCHTICRPTFVHFKTPSRAAANIEHPTIYWGRRLLRATHASFGTQSVTFVPSFRPDSEFQISSTSSRRGRPHRPPLSLSRQFTT